MESVLVRDLAGNRWLIPAHVFIDRFSPLIILFTRDVGGSHKMVQFQVCPCKQEVVRRGHGYWKPETESHRKTHLESAVSFS